MPAKLVIASIAALGLATACGPGARDQVDAQDEVDAGSRDVFEPDPGDGRIVASALYDADGVWLAYARMTGTDWSLNEVWATKTSLVGDPIIAPFRVDTIGPPAYPPAIARSGDRLLIGYAHADEQGVYVRVYDLNGVPLRGGDHEVPIAPSGAPVWRISDPAIVADSGAGFRIAAPLEDSTVSSELALVQVDASGDPTGVQTTVGIGGAGNTLHASAAVMHDGSTALAWMRDYSEEHVPGAQHSVATRVDAAGAVDTIQQANGPEGASELWPALGSDGDAVYLAWGSESDGQNIIALARYPAIETVLAELSGGLANYRPRIAISGPGRGAVAWIAREPRVLMIAGFVDRGTSIDVLPAIALPLVNDLDGGYLDLCDLVHVGDQRYFVTWSEDPSGDALGSRLYARMIAID